MRNAILAAALLVCVPAWAQTALPPQWGTSSNAAPTAKRKAGDAKKPVKVKPGKAAVTQPAPEAPALRPLQPAAPVNSAPAQSVYTPVQPVPVPVPIPARAAAAPPASAPTPSPPEAAAAGHEKSAPVKQRKTATAKQIPAARKKIANADLLTPAKPRAAVPPADASARPALAAPVSPGAVPSPSAANSAPAASAAAPQPAYIAPPYVPPPVTNYSAPVAPATAAAASPPSAHTYTVQPVGTAAIPTNAAGQPLPGAYVPTLPPAARAPAALPSLVAGSPRSRRKAAARDAALATPPPFIDISAPLSIGVTPAYPGTAPLAMRFDYDMDNGAPLDLSEFSMSTHTGTHIDAPLHFLRGAPSIDQVPLEQLNGPALVINIDPGAAAITAAELERYPWRGARRILFRTRNSVNEWIVDPQFHPDYTFLAPDAAELLANGGVELVGIDYLSIEQYGAPARTHVILLSKGIAIVEGLDLRQVPAGEYDLTLLPLKILGHEAAPARAVLRRR